MPTIQDRGGVRFAEFIFHSDTGELIGPHGSSRLQPQPAKVLMALLARPGELVSRDELKRLLWPDTHVETDQGLNFCVRQIRAALGDDAENGRIIETLPRRGYRLVVPVEKVTPEGQPPATMVVAEPSAPSWRGRSGFWQRAVTGGVVMALAVGAILWSTRGGRAGAPAASLRVAIIPIVAPANERWMNELNAAITEQLVARLTTSDGGRFGVIGPATTARFSGDLATPPTQIGKQLGAAVILSGGIRPSDSTLFFQAIRASDGVHVFVWRERVWNRSSADVVTSILDGLRPKLVTEAESRGPGVNGR